MDFVKIEGDLKQQARTLKEKIQMKMNGLRYVWFIFFLSQVVSGGNTDISGNNVSIQDQDNDGNNPSAQGN